MYRTLSAAFLCFSGLSVYWPLVTLFLLAYFLFSSNFYFVSALNVSQTFTTIDSISLFMVFLLFLIIYISYLSSIEFGSFKLITFVFLGLSFFCYQVFSTSHLFSLYFFYEASLIPILYIIIKWGSYPERSLSAIIMLVYTLLFGAPVLILIIYILIIDDKAN